MHIKTLLKPQSNKLHTIIYVSVESKIYLCKLKYIVFSLHFSQIAIMRCNLAVRRYQTIGKSHTGVTVSFFPSQFFPRGKNGPDIFVLSRVLH